MDLKFLEFEQPIAELEARIDALKFVGEDSELNISEEISRLRNKSESLTRSIFSNLTAWQIAQLARHQLGAVFVRRVRAGCLAEARGAPGVGHARQ